VEPGTGDTLHTVCQTELIEDLVGAARALVTNSQVHSQDVLIRLLSLQP
jgi:hypothetical protein